MFKKLAAAAAVIVIWIVLASQGPVAAPPTDAPTRAPSSLTAPSGIPSSPADSNDPKTGDCVRVSGPDDDETITVVDCRGAPYRVTKEFPVAIGETGSACDHDPSTVRIVRETAVTAVTFPEPVLTDYCLTANVLSTATAALRPSVAPNQSHRPSPSPASSPSQSPSSTVPIGTFLADTKSLDKGLRLAMRVYQTSIATGNPEHVRTAINGIDDWSDLVAAYVDVTIPHPCYQSLYDAWKQQGETVRTFAGLLRVANFSQSPTRRHDAQDIARNMEWYTFGGDVSLFLSQQTLDPTCPAADWQDPPI